MQNFYTNVEIWGSKILYRGVENGRRVQRREDYFPTLFVRSDKPTKYQTIYGEYMAPVKPGNIRETRDFVKQYDGVENFKIYGNQRYQYCYLADKFPEEIHYDHSLIKIANLDIEVGSDNGFPEPAFANEEITAITVKKDGVYNTFGCGDYQNYRDDVTYWKCRDEFDLIRKFLAWWESDYPDIMTGWNIDEFDIRYIVNRILKLFGEKEVRRLSPWNVVNNKIIDMGMDKKVDGYSILGIATLDLMALYKKYAPEGKSQETYRLDNIAHVELGERKLSYEEYGSLHNLYKENYQLFIDYNIKDVDLVDRIDAKNGLIDLALTLSYDNKCNFDDVYQQVRMWDVICFHYLKAKDFVLPPLEKHEKESMYVGAYVKEPIVGYHHWVASFDVNSEYPSVIMGSNISPETIIEPENYTDAMRGILGSISVDSLLKRQTVLDFLEKLNITVTPNGQFYRRDKQGFMPALVEKMFAERKKYKQAMLDAEQEYEDETNEDKKAELKKKISRFKNLQLSKKVSLNSLYGALGNRFFRFFDLRNAIAVTTTSQLTIRWIENNLNAYLQKTLKTEKDYVIAVDTDSVYLNLADLVGKTLGLERASNNIVKTIAFLDKICDTAIQPVINKSCAALGRYLNVYQHKIVMKREVLADKVIWTSKKHYILNVYNSEGVQYHTPKKKIMGLDLVKSSTPTACRDKMREAVDVILQSGEAEVQEFIKRFREDFNKLPLADISFPRGVNGLDKYANDKTIYGSKTPIHTRASLIYNNFIRNNKLDGRYPLIRVGDKIKYIYLKVPNHLRSDVVAFPQGGIPKEFDLDRHIDYNTQFEKSFIKPLNIILNAIGWKAEKTSSLEDFFE